MMNTLDDCDWDSSKYNVERLRWRCAQPRFTPPLTKTISADLSYQTNQKQAKDLSSNSKKNYKKTE